MHMYLHIILNWLHVLFVLSLLSRVAINLIALVIRYNNNGIEIHICIFTSNHVGNTSTET